MDASLPEELILPGDAALNRPKEARRTRVPNGEAARKNHQILKEADRKRSNKRALHKAMVDGGKPFPEDNSGQCNLNFQDGKAIMAQSGVPYYSIFNGVRNYAEIKPSFNSSHPDHARWGDTIARWFHEMLSEWNGFDWNVQQASYWMRLHGVGPCYFDKMGDWRFRAVETGMVLVPDGSASCVDDRLPMVEIIVPYRAHELYAFIRDAEAAKTSGWKVEAVKNVIRYACRNQEWARNPAGGVASWEVFEQMFNNNDIFPSLTGGFINCVHQLFKEWDGKITKTIITEDAVHTNPDDTASQKDSQFLFQSLGCYDSYSEALVVFFKDIGDGTWHSVKGYASDAFDTLVVTNQLYCAMIDAARVDATILLQFQTTAQRDKMDKFRIQRGITKLPVGTTIQQGRLQGSMQGATQVAQMLSTKLNNNIGNFQGRGMSREDGKGETVTATEVDARVAKEASLSQGEMTLFFGYLDHLYTEMYRRASDPNTTDEDAMLFQERCIQDGVPPEALLEPEWVRANRESGYGSPAMRQMILQQLAVIAPQLPEEGKKNLLDMQISATAGPDKVALLNPREHIPDMDDAWAAMENAMIEGGNAPVIANGQNDVVHLHSHLNDATETLTPVKEAMDAGQSDPEALQSAYEYTQLMAEHCELHLGRLRQDPVRADEAKFFEAQLAHVTSFSGKLRGAVISARKDAQLAAQEAAQATSLGALDQARLESAKINDQIAVSKAATKMKIDAEKASQKMKIEAITTAERVRLEREKSKAKPEPQAA